MLIYVACGNNLESPVVPDMRMQGASNMLLMDRQIAVAENESV
jgi:hypothetical protein